MLEYQKALINIQNLAKTKFLETEIISIAHATNRILAQELFSPENVPAFNNSAMDGFALRADETILASKEAPIVFEIKEVIGAGESSITDSSVIQKYSCVEIMTGAPVPDQYNAVIKVEDVEVLKTKAIKITHPIVALENIRRQGEDYKIGSMLLKKSTILMPEHIMALATLGQDQVCVYKKPKIVVLSTGKELVPYTTKKLQGSQIRNSTELYLMTYLTQIGCEVEFAGTAKDHPEEFFNLIKKIEAIKPDVIVTTGAVSMGKYDFIKSTLLDLNAEILFHKVAIRPGKPFLFAKMKSGIPFFGMPGNPISTAVGARFFLTPYLRELNKQKPENPLKARLTKDTKKPDGLRCFFKASVNFSDYTVECLPGQASFMISPFTKSNSWLIFPEDGTLMNQNSEIDIYPLYPLHYNWGSM